MIRVSERNGFNSPSSVLSRARIKGGLGVGIDVSKLATVTGWKKNLKKIEYRSKGANSIESRILGHSVRAEDLAVNAQKMCPECVLDREVGDKQSCWCAVFSFCVSPGSGRVKSLAIAFHGSGHSQTIAFLLEIRVMVAEEAFQPCAGLLGTSCSDPLICMPRVIRCGKVRLCEPLLERGVVAELLKQF